MSLLGCCRHTVASTWIHLRVTLVTEIRFHLELFRGCTWKGDAIQDLQLIGLFAGIGSHNIHIQTFPELKWKKTWKAWKWCKTLCTNPTLNEYANTYQHLNFEWILEQICSSDKPFIAQSCSLRNTETKLSRIRMCLGNFASRCDLAKKPKNGISCCSLSDRPSVITWAVVPSSSVAATSNNKVLPAFP